MLNKNLAFSEKYNWWTPHTKNISKKIKLSYIMSYWTIQEVYFIFKNFDTHTLLQWFQTIKNDSFSLNQRRKSFLKVLFEEKNNNNI